MKKTEDGSILYENGDKATFIGSGKNNEFIINSGIVVRLLVQIIPENSKDVVTVVSTAVFPDMVVAKEGVKSALSKRIKHLDKEKELLQHELVKFNTD